MTRKFGSIKPTGNSVQCIFSWPTGTDARKIIIESTDTLDCLEEKIAEGERRLRLIKRKIDEGTMSEVFITKLFPHSPEAKRDRIIDTRGHGSLKERNLGYYFDRYVQFIREQKWPDKLAQAHDEGKTGQKVEGYRTHESCANQILEYWDRKTLFSGVSSYDWKDYLKKGLVHFQTGEPLSSSRINNYFTVWRWVFDDAIGDYRKDLDTRTWIDDMKRSVSNRKRQKREVVKFSLEDIMKFTNVDLALVQKYMGPRCKFKPEQELNKILHTFWTGCRQEETNALGFQDVNMVTGETLIERALVSARWKYPKTKDSTRTITQNEQAMAIMRRQLELNQDIEIEIEVMQMDSKTMGAMEKHRPVFVSTATGKPWDFSGHYSRRFFKALLKASGVDPMQTMKDGKQVERTPNHVRHGYISMAVDHGLFRSTQELADYVGTSVAMIDKHYRSTDYEEVRQYHIEANEKLQLMLMKRAESVGVSSEQFH